jgi:glc operon protein GlcG
MKMKAKISTCTQTVLSTSSALELVARAVNIGRDKGVAVSVWTVGPSLEKIAFVAAENATPHSKVTSLKKAQTAASTRRATGWMPPALAIELPVASDGLLTNVPGGVPIKISGTLVGGLGIAGGTVEQDAEIAAEVLAAFGADPL